MHFAALEIVVKNEKGVVEKELQEEIKELEWNCKGWRKDFVKESKEKWDLFDNYRTLRELYTSKCEEAIKLKANEKSCEIVMRIMEETIGYFKGRVETLEKEKAQIQRSSTRRINTLRTKLGMPKLIKQTKKKQK